MHKKQPFYQTFNSLCHYGCSKMLGSLDIWILGWLQNWKRLLLVHALKTTFLSNIRKSLLSWRYKNAWIPGYLDPWMITKLKKVVFCPCIKKTLFIKHLKIFAIMAVQKCLDPWIFGSLDDYKIKKVVFCVCIKNNLFIKHLKVFAIMAIQNAWIPG